MIVGLLIPLRGSVTHREITPRFHTITPEWVLHSNFGCCRGTTKKSETYKISGALERRAVPIRELVENKERRLKKKKPALCAGVTVTFAECELKAYPWAACAGRLCDFATLSWPTSRI
jgi:hypothetical protein